MIVFILVLQVMAKGRLSAAKSDQTLLAEPWPRNPRRKGNDETRIPPASGDGFGKLAFHDTVDSCAVQNRDAGTSMREHWASGYRETVRTLQHRKWLAKPPEHIGMTVHDIHRDVAN